MADDTSWSLGDGALIYNDLDQLIAAVREEAQEGDHVVIMSNGGFGGFHQKLKTALEEAHVR